MTFTETIYVQISGTPILFGATATPHPVGNGLLVHEFSRSHTTTHHSRQDSSGRGISPSHRPLPDNTHNTSNTVTETSTRQHTQHQQHSHRDLYQTTHTTLATQSQRPLPVNTHNTSNRHPQSQQGSGSRTTLQTARPLGQAWSHMQRIILKRVI